MTKSTQVSFTMEQLYAGLKRAKDTKNEPMMNVFQDIISGKSDNDGLYRIDDNGLYIFQKEAPVAYYLIQDQITLEKITNAFVNAHLKYNHFMKKELGALLRRINDLRKSDDKEKRQKEEWMIFEIYENEELFKYVTDYGQKVSFTVTPEPILDQINTRGKVKEKTN